MSRIWASYSDTGSYSYSGNFSKWNIKRNLNPGFLLIKKSPVSHIPDSNSFLSVSSVSICIIEMVCAQSKAIILKIIYHWSYMVTPTLLYHLILSKLILLLPNIHCYLSIPIAPSCWTYSSTHFNQSSILRAVL